MSVLERIKHIFHSASEAPSSDIEKFKIFLNSMPQSMFLLDKNKYIIGIYNISKSAIAGYSIDDFIGKRLDEIMVNTTSPIYQACYILNETVDKVYRTGKSISFQYKILNDHFEATVSKVSYNLLLSEVRKITDIVHRVRDIERRKNTELSFVMTAGGLTSWTYNTETKIFSSSYNNNVIGAQINLDELIALIVPEYRQVVLDMIDGIINHNVQHKEITVRVKNLAGVYQWSNVHAIPNKYSEDGKVISIIGSQKDITTEYEYNEQIKALNKQNELVLNNIKSTLVYIDIDYKVIWSNINSVFKYKEATKFYQVGKHCYESFGRETPCESCVMRRALESHKNESTEFIIENNVSLAILANPIIGTNSEIEGVILRIDDITEKIATTQKIKESEQEALATNQLLLAILNNMSMPLVIKDANNDFRYIIANKEYCNSLGLEEKDIIGENDYNLFPKEEADQYRASDTAVMESGKTKIIENERISLKDGVAIWHTTKTPFIQKENNKKLLIVIALNITERYNAYEELAIAKKKAEESDKLKSAFLANMSHEIRTPLNAIVGFTEMLKECENHEERAEFWNIISTNSDLLLRLINDILDLSKIEAGTIELKSIEFDLADHFNGIYYTLNQRNVNPNVKFICNNPYLVCKVKLDNNRITQIMTNFVTNAFKFTSSGDISMGYEYIDGGIKLYCEDTGIGIAADKIDKVFLRFSKLNSFAQGTGLGLAICKAIIDGYNGKIGVESEVGKGSQFWAWIPCDANFNDQEDDIMILMEEKSELKNMEPLKILVAEDNDSNFLLIKIMLKKFSIIHVVNGADAVEKVKNETFDIVLMDMRMPVMGGVEAIQKIREFNKEIPIITLTANAFDSDKQLALDAGSNDFITKPMDKSTLLNTILRYKK